MVLTLTDPPQNNSNISLEDPPVDNTTKQQMAGLVEGSPAQNKVRSAPDPFLVEQYILDIIRNNYSKGKREDIPQLLNTILAAPHLTNVEVLGDPNIYKRVENPYHGRPDLFTSSLRREPMKIKRNVWEDLTGSVEGQVGLPSFKIGDDIISTPSIIPGFSVPVTGPRQDEFALDLYGNPAAVAPEGSEHIATEYGESPERGQLYWNSTANKGAGSYEYKPTWAETVLKAKTDIIKPSLTGVMEFPNMAMSLAYLANVGINHASYHTMSGKEWVFNWFHQAFGGENVKGSNAEKYLQLALGESPEEAEAFAEELGFVPFSLKPENVAQFRQEYEELIQPIKDSLGLGSFGPSKDKDLMDRFLEEIFVMGPVAFTAAALMIRAGLKAATPLARSFVRVNELGKIVGMTGGIKLSKVVGLQNKTLKTLREKMINKNGEVDQTVLNNIKRLEPEEQVNILKSYGVPAAEISMYIRASELLKLQRQIGTKSAQKKIKRYADGDFIENPSVSRLTTAFEAKRALQSEIAANAAFTIGEQYFPDSPFIQMAMGVAGAWSGGSVPYYLATQTPANRITNKFSRDNYRVQLYGMYSAVGMDEQAAEQVLKLYDEFEPLKNAPPDEKIMAAYEIAQTKGDLKKMVRLGERAKSWTVNVNPEELQRLTKLAENTSKLQKKLNKLFPHIEEELNVTLSDLIALPSIDFMEKNLLNNINTAMSFGLEKIPMLAEYTNLAARKKQSILAVKKMLKKLGDTDNLTEDLVVFQEAANKYIARVEENSRDAKIKFDNIVDENFPHLKDELADNIAMREKQLDDQIDRSVGYTDMSAIENQNSHLINQSKRLDEAMIPINKKIADAYDAIDFEHVIEDSEGIAGTLEALVLEAEKIYDPTRNYGKSVRSPKAILVTARQRYLNDVTKEMNGDNKIAYINTLTEEILNKGIDTSDEGNSALSRQSIEDFNDSIENVIKQDLDPEDLDKALMRIADNRLKKLSRINANPASLEIAGDISAGNIDDILEQKMMEIKPYIPARYTVNEFASLRSLYSRGSVTSKGSNRHTFRVGAEQLDSFIKRVSKGLDARQLKQLRDADDVYYRYMERFGVGIGKKLLSKTENKQPKYFPVNGNGVPVSPDDPSFIDLVGRGHSFMPAFINPFWKGRVNVNEMDEAVRMFKTVFSNSEGNIHPEDAQMLLDAFALKMWESRGEVGSSAAAEINAYTKFAERFKDIIEQAGERGDAFLSVGGLYKQRNPTRHGENIEQARLDRKQQKALDQQKKSSTDTINWLIGRRVGALKNSVFSGIGSETTRPKLREIIFGRGVRHPGPFPTDVRDIERSAEQAARFEQQINELQALGIPIDEVQGQVMSSSTVENFKQLLNWAREEGVKTIGGEKVNVLEATQKALKGLLVEELVESAFNVTGKQMPKVGIRELKGQAIGSTVDNIISNTIDLAEYGRFVEENRKAFVTLLGEEHTKILDEIFEISYAMAPDDVHSALSGLVKGWSATTLQSQFWAIARSVISVRFVAGMIGLQAYRMQSTKFFEELLQHPQAGKIMIKAMKSNKPLTRKELSNFKTVMLTTFGPKVAAKLTQDHIENQRDEYQKTTAGVNLSEAELLEQAERESRKDTAKEFKAWQLGTTVDKLPDDPINQLVNTSKLIDYIKRIDEAKQNLTPEQQRRRNEARQKLADVDNQMTSLNLNLGLQ